VLLVPSHLDRTRQPHGRAAAPTRAFHLRDRRAVRDRRGVFGLDGLVVDGRGLVRCALDGGLAPAEAIYDEPDQEDQDGGCANGDAGDGAGA